MNEYIDSDYWEAAGKFLNTDIIAYVENFEDQLFWEAIFKKYAPDLRIDFHPHSNDETFKSGKTFVLSDENLQNSGKNLILCVDSDYGFLIGDPKLQHPFVFHTYTYSIENYKLSPEILASVIKKACFISKVEFSFLAFWDRYSNAVSKLFLYILYFEQKKLDQVQQGVAPAEIETEELLSLKSVTQVLSLNSTDIELKDNHCESCIQSITKKVTQLLDQLSQKHPHLALPDLSHYQQCELSPSDIKLYLYIRGHTLYDSVVKLLMEKLIKKYTKEKRDKYAAQNTDQSKKKLDEYKNKIKNIDWKTLLYDSYDKCIQAESIGLLKCIKHDIDQLTKNYHKPLS